jgi:hypothetical protein
MKEFMTDTPTFWCLPINRIWYGTIVFNVLSAILNYFHCNDYSYSSDLFKEKKEVYTYMP